MTTEQIEIKNAISGIKRKIVVLNTKIDKYEKENYKLSCELLTKQERLEEIKDEIEEMDFLSKEEPYCIECGGEYTDLNYIRTVANGDEWECKLCKNVFITDEYNEYE